MKRLLSAVLGLVTISMGYVHAAGEFVMVDVPCYERNAQGECTDWGAMLKGCLNPSAPCEANISYENTTARCTAPAGQSCNAIIPTKNVLQKGVMTIKVPCTAQIGQTCFAWGVLNKGCKAPENGTCGVDFRLGDRHAICKADSKGTCNSKIVLRANE